MSAPLTQIATGHASIDLAAAAYIFGRDIRQMPYIERILLENLWRNKIWGRPVEDRDIAALLNPDSDADSGLPLYVARVILPDSSGLPVLQDLAVLREAVAQKTGGDGCHVDTMLPVDLIVDHSLQVDFWGHQDAFAKNLQYEIARNKERYIFLKWAQQAFHGLRLYPPGSGIIHQINLEKIASVVCQQEHDGKIWAFPDFVIGGDSHTTMINGLGVLGWGVGGIDAEAALLGQAYMFPRPEVVGVHLVGTIRPPATTTDAALLITQQLREADVAGQAVEFFGKSIVDLPVAVRATFANMAPEYGATCGFFPIDAQSLLYLRQTGRHETQIARVAAYAKTNFLWRDETTPPPTYRRIIEIDLEQAIPSVAGPRRPQDRMPLTQVAQDFTARLSTSLGQGGFSKEIFGKMDASFPSKIATKQKIRAVAQFKNHNRFSKADMPMTKEPRQETPVPDHGAIVLAAITSCTNTSNPAVMLAAGLLAKKAVALGLSVPKWVKTSLAPGSHIVGQYLAQTGLLEPLEALGFHIIGYGCSSCGGKSGPLEPDIVADIEARELVVASVLSGNRNFDGRIHRLIRANYIMAPPLVVLYALAGRINLDVTREPIGHNEDGQAVFMADLWPQIDEIDALLPQAQNELLYRKIYAQAKTPNAHWEALEAPQGALYPWDKKSHYLVPPPFFTASEQDKPMDSLAQALKKAYVLAAFGDSLTTDHISPSGEIPLQTAAGQYLLEQGIKQQDFNTYVGRRGNFEVMSRATFANIRIKNALLPNTEGGLTRHFPDGVEMRIFDAARAYLDEGVGAIILAGKEYGTGSSRDWAAKGSALLGVRAVLAQSFERIHRANLVGMGVLPLQFMAGEGWQQLGLSGEEEFSFDNIAAAIIKGEPVTAHAFTAGKRRSFQLHAQLLSAAERQLMRKGGILKTVLQDFCQSVGQHGAQYANMMGDKR